MKHYSFQIFADYNQILLHDDSCEGDLSGLWNGKTYEQMIVTSSNSLSISTARNVDLPVEIVICDDKPLATYEKWDHIVQCSLKVTSGSLVVRGVSDYLQNAARISLESGQYTVWVFYGGLNTVSNDCLEGEDHYKIILWRSNIIASFELLKSYR